jgi:lysophospholipase L1-like esterase
MRLNLCLVLVALLGVTCALAAPGPYINLALNRPYVANTQTLPGWTGLVDGEKDTDTAPGCFATSNANTYPKYVVIDLGAECSISKVVVYNSANGNTRTVSLSCSTDATSYKKLRDPDFIFADGSAAALSVSFQPRPARYVRVTMPDTWKKGLGGDNCLFLREIEVFGARPTETKVVPDPFALAEHQTPTVTNRSVAIFRRYCLDTAGPLSVAVVGDLFTVGYDQDTHWAGVAAEELRKFYPNKAWAIKGIGGTEGSIAFGLDWAQDNRGSLAPDLIIVAYGTQAALAGATVDEFRTKYQALVSELVDNTRALVVVLTPLPFPAKSGSSSRGFDEAVEQVATSSGLPLLRTAAVLAKISGDKSLLYADNTHLSITGNRAVGTALADLLH